MSEALVTGGYGFIGSFVVAELEKRHYSVQILDTYQGTFITQAEFIEADVSVEIPLDVSKFDVVFHCAGLLGTETLFDRIREAAEVNIIGTINVLDWARGNDDITVVQPNLLGDWLNIYMISKHCAEKIGLMYDKEFGLKYLSVRPSDVYGPRQTVHEKKAAPVFIERALNNIDLPIYGDGTSWVNYVYVEDVAKFLVDAYEAGAHGEAIDFCRPVGDMGIADFAKKVIEIAGSGSKLAFEPMRPGQPGNVQNVPYNLRRASQITDMTALTSLEDGLKETINWYRMASVD